MVRDFTCVAFSPDQEWLYAGTETGDFAAVALKSLVFAACPRVTSNGIHSLLPIRDGLVIGGGDGKVVVMSGYGKVGILDGFLVALLHSSSVLCVCQSLVGACILPVPVPVSWHVLMPFPHVFTPPSLPFLGANGAMPRTLRWIVPLTLLVW